VRELKAIGSVPLSGARPRAAGWHACPEPSSCAVGYPQNASDRGTPRGPITPPEGPARAAPLRVPGGKGARLWHRRPGHGPESQPAPARGMEESPRLPELHAELVVPHHFQALAWR